MDEWMINKNNFPCGYSSGLNAIQLTNKTMEEVYDLCRQDALVDPMQDNTTKSSDKPTGVVACSGKPNDK